MVEYLKLLKQHHLCEGEFDIKKVGIKTPEYFWTHQIWVDFRGDLRVHPDAFLGFGIKLLTASHTFKTGVCGDAILKRVWIDKDCFVGSFSILYNCWLQHHSVVAAGAVVRNITVPPYCIVEGNPAKIVKRFVNGKWQRL